MNDVLNRHRNRTQDTITAVPQKEVFIVLPYLGLHSKVVAQHKSSDSKFRLWFC